MPRRASSSGRTYYWKIAEVNDAEAISTWAGPVWSFVTEEYTTVEGFETYNDDVDAGTTIFDTWIDGWVNDNGSTVGYFDAPFAEGTIVHSGRRVYAARIQQHRVTVLFRGRSGPGIRPRTGPATGPTASCCTSVATPRRLPNWPTAPS